MESENRQRIYINEVVTRDGFQIEPTFVPTEEKIKLINRLSRSGVAMIEATSFTSPKAIPNLRDAEEVMRQIDRVAGVRYTVLIPNEKVAKGPWLRRGRDQPGHVGEPDAQPGEPADELRAVVGDVRRDREIRGGRAGFDQRVTVHQLRVSLRRSRRRAARARCGTALPELGIQSVTLCDTTGMANPRQVRSLSKAVKALWPDVKFTMHFHNTRGMGLANAVAALEAGMLHFDASLAGLGGCPFAPGASGNICTEDTVHMFEQMGFEMGVNIDLPPEIARDLPASWPRRPRAVDQGGKADKRFPVPERLGKDQVAMAGKPAAAPPNASR